jgi:hypothetical protein
VSGSEKWVPVFAGTTRDDKELRMASEAKLLMAQFLAWVAARPRGVGETRATWASTCPLNCAWEDALADNMVVLSRDGRVELTAFGRAHLEGCL